MKSIITIAALMLLLTKMTNSQWISQNSNTNQRLLTCFFLNENLGWAGGNEGCVLKTTDGGINWNYYSIGTKYTIHAIHFADSLKGWAALYTFTPSRAGYIIATTDGGTNWYYQYYIDGFTIHNVYFYDENIGWAVGSNGIFLRTLNGGATWQEDFVSPQWSWSLCFVNPNVGWVGDGYSGYVRKTTDGGFTWQYNSVPTYSTMYDIDFVNENVGWAVGEYGHIIKTEDGGELWSLQNNSYSQELNDVEFVNENNGWAIGMGGIILNTTNGGTTWIQQRTYDYSDLFAVCFPDSNNGWAVGDNGIIFHTINGGVTSVEEGQIVGLPTEYNVAQNYPNPFNPSTTIKYSIPQSSNVIIKVFDVLGNEVVTLVSEEKPSGTYELNWNAANLPSGVYFYRLQAGSFVETKKMILLK